MHDPTHRPCACFRLLAALLTAAVAGCTAVGPNYARPAVPTPTAYKSATSSETTTPQLGHDWWKLFNDPQLDQLEDQAIKENQSIQAAMASVEEARAAAKGVKSAFYPVISFDPSVTRERTSANENISGFSSGGSTFTNYVLPFDLTYEVDIWGQVRRSVEAANAQVQASLADYEVVLQTLEADLAEDYFTLHSYDAQYQTLVDTVATYQKQLDLTNLQFKAGLESEADVASAEALLDATKTQQLETARERDEEEYAIAILANRAPADFSLPPNPLNVEPPVIPAGLPADLLRRRPDVAAAEANLAEASAQIGVAISAYYPQLSLTGAAGFESVSSSNLLDWSSRIWSLGPSVSLPIFNGGKLAANVELQRATYNQFLAQYRTQVLSAYQDVENSLTDLHSRADEAQAQAAAVQASQDYVRLTQLQYQQGLVDYLTVIDAYRTLLTNQLTAEQILNERLVSTVLLIKAIGGGWDGATPVPPKN
jgi:outer membrane protein, multidrug efflux system